MRIAWSSSKMQCDAARRQLISKRKGHAKDMDELDIHFEATSSPLKEAGLTKLRDPFARRDGQTLRGLSSDSHAELSARLNFSCLRSSR